MPLGETVPSEMTATYFLGRVVGEPQKSSGRLLKSDRCVSRNTKPTRSPNTRLASQGYFDIFFFFDFFVVAMAHFLLV